MKLLRFRNFLKLFILAYLLCKGALCRMERFNLRKKCYTPGPYMNRLRLQWGIQMPKEALGTFKL